MSGLVLLVEDDRAIRVLPERWLEDSGYTVQALDTGEDCLQALGNSLPDAILLDVNLPGLSGIDVLEAIRDSQHFLPVIMMTSEMPELLGLSDRIFVLADGRLSAEFTREEATQEKRLDAAIG